MRKSLLVLVVFAVLIVEQDVLGQVQYSVRTFGTLPGGTFSQGGSINNSGQVAGLADNSKGNGHAFFYSSGTMQDLGILGGNQSKASHINNLGQITGQADTSGGDGHAYLYSGTMKPGHTRRKPERSHWH